MNDDDLAAIEAKLLKASAIHPTGCRLWVGNVDSSNGYARLTFRGTRYYAHRAAHMVWKGPIPAGHEVDHLCFDRRCISPDHLEAVTQDENKRRAMAIRPLRVFCPRGHRYIRPATRTKPYCLECHRQRHAAWRAENPIQVREPVTECVHGHPYDEENTRWRVRASDGYEYRVCRTCERERRSRAPRDRVALDRLASGAAS